MDQKKELKKNSTYPRITQYSTCIKSVFFGLCRWSIVINKKIEYFMKYYNNVHCT